MFKDEKATVDVLILDFVRTLLKDWGSDDEDEPVVVTTMQDYIITK
jgi:hypothetical protein